MSYKQLIGIGDVTSLTSSLAGKADSAHTHAAADLALSVPRWVKYTVGYAALAAAGLTNDVELFSLPAQGVIHDVVLRHSASFTGGLISAYTLSVGIAANLAKYAAAFNTFQAPGAGVLGLGAGRGMESVSGATSIRVAAISVTGLLNTATAGSADIWVLGSVLP